MGRDGYRHVGIGAIERNPFVENQRVRLQVVVRLGLFVFLGKEWSVLSFRRREIESWNPHPATRPEWMACERR
jgi:hypothetical protein